MANMHFQFKVGGEWRSFPPKEDGALKRIFLAGLAKARYSIRSAKYEFDFRRMTRRRLESSEICEIRPPHGWRQPSESIMHRSFTVRVRVPSSGPGNTVMVPHPGRRGDYIRAAVPRSAKAGQSMLVPFPEAVADAQSLVSRASYTAHRRPSRSRGSRTAMAATGTFALGALAAAGVAAGDYIAEEGWEMVADGALEQARRSCELVSDAGNAAADGVADLF